MQVTDPQDSIESGKSQEREMPYRTSTAQNTLVQATIFKKCDRTFHKPGSNKGCAAGTCQHTCEARQVPDCAQVDRPLLGELPAA